jgi:putative transposase
VWQNEGQTIAQVCLKLEGSEPTFHRWRHTYGGVKADEMRRPKELEGENRRLKLAVSDLTLDNQILKDDAHGKR